MTIRSAVTRNWLVATIILTFATVPGGAQSVLEYPDARVEIRGLRTWSTEMLLDSLRLHAPETRLASHACAAVLRQKLGFADASVHVFSKGWGGRERQEFVISVVEPGDSARVRYRALSGDSLPDRPEWAVLHALFEQDPGAFQTGLRDPELMLADSPADSLLDAAGEVRRGLRQFVLDRRSEADRRLAVSTLAADRNYRNRMAAAVILVGAGDSDEAWHALADALRDPVAIVAGMAIHAMHSLTTGAPRRIDWRAATPVLRALLDGTQLFAFNTTLDVLTETADAAWVREALLPGWNPLLVLHMLSSIAPDSRHRAERFLSTVSGSSPGPAPDAWRRWLREAGAAVDG